MSEASGPEAEALRLWLEAQAEALSGAARSAGWERAEELFRAWCRLLEGFGPGPGRRSGTVAVVILGGKAMTSTTGQCNQENTGGHRDGKGHRSTESMKGRCCRQSQ